MNMSERFRALRKESGLTLRALAERIEADGFGAVAHSYLHELERNPVANPTWVTIKRIARAYGMTPQQLVADDDDFELARPKLNYIDRIATEIATHCDDDFANAPDYDQRLYRLYAVLALGKGYDISTEDVHNAWSAWIADHKPDHQSLVPYGDLPLNVQELDDKYARAIGMAVGKLKLWPR